jgi:hypothetical protein
VREVARSTNPVFLSWAVATLAEHGIEAMVFDQHMSIMEGSIGILPRRILVIDEDADRAREILDAGPGADSYAERDGDPPAR